MANRTAKFASAVFLGILAGVPLTIPHRAAGAAADGCLTEPKGDTPDGKHWYYRVERGKRQCWYLRDEGDKPARSASSAASDKPAQRRAEIEPTRSVADAHAEYTTAPQTAPSQTAPREPVFVTQAPSAAAPAASPVATAAEPAAAAPDASAGSSAIASRWPDPTATAPAPSAAPALAQPVTQLAAADASDATTSSPPPASALPPPATSDVPPTKTPVSLQMLLLAIFGALALAGLTASVIYRLGSRRRRPAVQNARLRRGANWPDVERVRTPPPPWVEAPAADYAAPEEVAHVESRSTFSDLDKIEAFLAQMAKQQEMPRHAQN